MLINVYFAIIGLIAGSLINVLADDLPARERPRQPHCPRCGHEYVLSGWLAAGQLLQGGKCPKCELPTRRRSIMVEAITVIIFASLPWLIQPPADLIIYSIYIAILLLVIVIDIEHRLVLHVVTFPTTAFAVVASLFLSQMNIALSIVGAITGFIIFFILFFVGEKLFGRGALGFGDVTLATMLGAMLGFKLIFLALIFGILLAGLWSLIILLSRRASLRSYFAYGPFLAVSGIVMIIWGEQIYNWFSAG